MRLVIHCGLHKTGTTALQAALIKMAPGLAERGVSFPSFEPGKPSAHHWLAKAIKGPHIYSKSRTNISGLIEAARATDPHTVCLSSEDFETHLRHPRAIARLMDIAGELKANVVFLIYVRNQVEYLESLYLQFLRMGLGKDASEVVEEVLETGQFQWRRWVIHFDYAAAIRDLAKTESEIVVQNYHALKNDCIIEDFLSCIGEPASLKPSMQEARANSARLNNNLQRFVNNREDNLDASVLTAVDAQLGGLRPRLSADAQEKIKQRFWDGNEEIKARFGVDLNQTFERPVPSEPSPIIDRIFEAKTLEYLSSQNASSAEQGGQGVAKLPEEWLATV